MLKSLLALSALVGAFYLSISYQYGDPGWQLEFRTREASARGDDQPEDGYDLKGLSVLNRAVIHIKENYVDPSRINERKMIGAAMEEVQRNVAEILVEIERDPNDLPTKLTVRIDPAERTFDLRDVDNLWQMSFKFKDIFRFIQENLKDAGKYRDIEYAAINGMLSTLDPHSVLLRPEDYREMKLTTRGKFGGLGIVIGVRDGQLTVLNPIEDTPATHAGIKAGDKILQINLDSTVNMALSDAVDMLRGPPNTKVDIMIMREGWTKARKFTLTRANIKVDSVSYSLLPGRVGVVRLRNFQNTTQDELKAALTAMRKQGKGIRGLIMDLRGNPGGLLDQAIKVADMFIDSGPIVTTVGYGDKLREPKMATRAGTEEPYPLVVLTDPSSASASEIVAGALKNHERAVLIGQQTFGKGSVQVIYDNKDDSALKLTIAQYLTPGDISIQSVGITPDILTKAVDLASDDVDFYRGEEVKGKEVDLPEHLDNETSRISASQKPQYTIRHLQDAAIAKQIEDNPNDIIVDFEISLAHDLILQTTRSQRDGMIQDAKQMIEGRITQEQQKIEAALKEKGIDWSGTVASTGKPVADVKITTNHEGNVLEAGDEVEVETTVTNTGDGPFAQLRAISRSDDEFFDGRELLFGDIPPGQSRTWKMKIQVPKYALTRRDPVKLEFKDRDGKAPAPAQFKVEVHQLQRPRFAFTYKLDDSAGNGDGVLQRGESGALVVDVQNVGEGQSFSTLGTLRNPDGDEERGIFIERGRQDLGVLKPGERKELRFEFKVKEQLKSDRVPITVNVLDSDLRELTSEKYTLRVAGDAQAVTAKNAKLTPKSGNEVRLRSSPVDDAPTLALADAQVYADGTLDGWYRIPLGAHSYAWLPEGEVQAADAPVAANQTRPAPFKGPPVITLSQRGVDVETQQDALTLNGEALSAEGVKDLLIFVNNRKVFFKANHDDKAHMRFSARVPLESGVNRITVVAREDEDLSSRETLIVNRNAEGHAQK
jgi:carboxyl-terminal processing protease